MRVFTCLLAVLLLLAMSESYAYGAPACNYTAFDRTPAFPITFIEKGLCNSQWWYMESYPPNLTSCVIGNSTPALLADYTTSWTLYMHGGVYGYEWVNGDGHYVGGNGTLDITGPATVPLDFYLPPDQQYLAHTMYCGVQQYQNNSVTSGSDTKSIALLARHVSSTTDVTFKEVGLSGGMYWNIQQLTNSSGASAGTLLGPGLWPSNVKAGASDGLNLINGSYTFTAGCSDSAIGALHFCDAGGSFYANGTPITVIVNFSGAFSSSTTMIPQPSTSRCSGIFGFSCSNYSVTFRESNLPDSGGLLGSISCVILGWLFQGACNDGQSVPYFVTVNDSTHVQNLLQGFDLLTCPFKIANEVKALGSIINLVDNASQYATGDLLAAAGQNVSDAGYGGNPCSDPGLNDTLTYLKSYGSALTTEAKAQIYGGYILGRGNSNFDPSNNDFIVGLNFQQLEITLKLSNGGDIRNTQITVSGSGEVFNESQTRPSSGGTSQCTINSNLVTCIQLKDANFSQVVSVGST